MCLWLSWLIVGTSEFSIINTGKNFLRRILVPEEMRPITGSWNRWNNEISQSTVENTGWKLWFTLFGRTSRFPSSLSSFSRQHLWSLYLTTSVRSVIHQLPVSHWHCICNGYFSGWCSDNLSGSHRFCSPPQSLHFCGYGRVFLYAIYKMCLLWLLLIIWSFIHFLFSLNPKIPMASGHTVRIRGSSLF